MKKVCSKCRKKRDVKNFYKNKSSKDNYQNNCKDCQRRYADNYYENNKEIILKKLAEKNKKN